MALLLLLLLLLLLQGGNEESKSFSDKWHFVRSNDKRSIERERLSILINIKNINIKLFI